jgi:hypothetical protein
LRFYCGRSLRLLKRSIPDYASAEQRQLWIEDMKQAGARAA